MKKAIAIALLVLLSLTGCRNLFNYWSTHYQLDSPLIPSAFVYKIALPHLVAGISNLLFALLLFFLLKKSNYSWCIVLGLTALTIEYFIFKMLTV